MGNGSTLSQRVFRNSVVMGAASTMGRPPAADRELALVLRKDWSQLSPTTTGRIAHRSPRRRLLTYLGVPYYLERQDGPQEPDPRMEVHKCPHERARSVPRRRLYQVRNAYGSMFFQPV